MRVKVRNIKRKSVSIQRKTRSRGAARAARIRRDGRSGRGARERESVRRVHRVISLRRHAHADRDGCGTSPPRRGWTLRGAGRILASHTREVSMRIFASLLVAVPVVVLAQGPTLVPGPTIPQTVIPGAGHSSQYMLRQPGVGVGVIAPVQGGGAVIVAPGYGAGYGIAPEYGWGAGVAGPGSTYVVPSPGGGTTIVGPGYGTTIVRPNPAGGTTIIGPNQPSTLIVPTQRGGSIILGPGGTGYAVPAPHGTYIQPPGGTGPLIIYDR